MAENEGVDPFPWFRYRLQTENLCTLTNSNGFIISFERVIIEIRGENRAKEEEKEEGNCG